MSESPLITTSDPSPVPAAYSVPAIAKLLDCSERHVWRLADQGSIPGRIKGLGRLVRFSRAAVDAWLAGQSKGRG